MSETVPNHRRANELYRPLPDRLVQILEALEQRQVCPAGACLVTRNVALQHVIIVRQGLVEVSVPAGNKHISIDMAGAGKVFGVRSVISGELPEINVACREECVIALLPRADFLRVVRQNPQMYFAVARILSADLMLAQQLIRQMPRAARSRPIHQA